MPPRKHREHIIAKSPGLWAKMPEPWSFEAVDLTKNKDGGLIEVRLFIGRQQVGVLLPHGKWSVDQLRRWAKNIVQAMNDRLSMGEHHVE